ncbi:MAG TPA: MXAN_5808 family serine peptidase [Anaeromyxobacteraceae bacterium]|nr:MXAN_5808 family serine peptidase [Anaeromyxobacteraceae bacterium]
MLPEPAPAKRSPLLLRLAVPLAAALTVAAALQLARVRAAAPGAEARPAVASNGAHAQAHRETPEEPEAGREAGYRLDDLAVYSAVLNKVAENYVDPRRIEPRAMLLAALDQVERTVAEVMVDGDPASDRVKVTVGQASREFDISGLTTIYSPRLVMGDVMAFVQKHLVAHKNLREIEYAAVNGMLSTLDPHSILLDARLFREMRLTTRGEFGGMGFVIAMRDGNLTVVKVLKNTPAQRAGIRAKDVIVKIEEQSTVNMDLQDAVDRLRGKPSTKVAISVTRAGWSEPRRLSIVRENIIVETVPFAKVLDGGIGYVKVSGFTAKTTREVRAALAQERTQAGGALRGLILDLRGNPGGLLEQAVEMSDLFLGSGLIVRTVGHDRRDVQVNQARPDRDDLTGLPMVVLVNNASASASEIVAGALKNNGRALVVGRQTFGKGSVQVLYDDLPGRPGDAPALKLTVYQYLTAGDVSIQEVGIAPDVLLLPGRVLKDAVNYFAPPRMMGEADLDRHFGNGMGPAADRRAEERRRRAEKAPLELRHLLDEKEDHVAKAMKAEQKREQAQKVQEESGEPGPLELEEEEVDANPDELVEDYQIRFARELLARAPFAERAPLLEAARQLVAERRGEEESRLEARLAQLGIDWSGGPATGTPRAVVTVTPPPGKRAQAGETLPWTVTVENRGDGPLRRLRAWTMVDRNPLLDRREFVFGLVKPGERRSWTVPLRLPRGLDTRRDDVTLHFEDDGGRAPPDAVTSVELVERPKPVFAFSVQVDDEAGGNGDGLIQRGEDLHLRVDVRNAGPGPSGERTYVSLKSLGDEKVFVKKGRLVVGALKPGEVKTAVLSLEVKKGFKPDAVPVRLQVVDEKTDEFVSEKLELPVASEAPHRAPAHGAVRVTAAQAVLQAGAGTPAFPVALAHKGALLPVVSRAGDFYKVEWQKGRHGFVLASQVEPSPRARREGTVSPVWQREPPRIALSPDPAKGAPVAEGDRWRLTGTASAPAAVAGVGTRLRDVFIYVNEQKVFFKVVPESGASSTMDFASDLPLKPGNNTVTVFAREDEEFQSRRSLVVHRRAPPEVAQQSK